VSLDEFVGTTWGNEASRVATAMGRRGTNPESVAVAVRRMRLAAEPFVGRHAAKEASNTVASVMVLEDGLADVAELAESSLRRLQRTDIFSPHTDGSPRVGLDVDVRAISEAMAAAWKGTR
jgi:hypothetical protein